MRVSTDFTAVRDEHEVLLFCTFRGNQVACLARRVWFVENAGDRAEERRQGWQSTWDGAEVPREWQPYAWATFTAPDPAVEEDVV